MDEARTPHAASARRARTRKNGEGSEFTYLDANGVTIYKAVETWGFTSDGKQVQVSGKSRTSMADARSNLFRNKVKRQVAAGELPPEALPLSRAQSVLTLAAWFDQWLPRQDIRESTRSQYESRFRIYIDPKFGSTPIRLLTGEQMVAFFRDELPAMRKADGTPRLGGTTIRGVYFILYAALEDARRQGKVALNPLDALEKAPKRTEKSREDKAKIARSKNWVPQHLLKNLEGHPDEARWLLALFAVRQSEVLGLTDTALKWRSPKRESRLEIFQQLSRHYAKHGCGAYDAHKRRWACGRQADRCPQTHGVSGLYLSQDLKTHSSERILPLVEPLYSALKRQQDAQVELRATPDFTPLPGPGMDRLLFTNKHGRPRRHQHDGREWKALLDRYEVPEALRLHDARALSVSILVMLGFEPLQIMRITGWSEGTLFAMLRTYSSQDVDYIRKPLEALGAKLLERRGVSE